MNTALVSNRIFSINFRSRTLGRFAILLLCAGFLAAPVASSGAELSQDTLTTWDAYVRDANARMAYRQGPFLHVNERPDSQRRLQQGEILVWSAGPQNPLPVPSGLIHDWMGAAFIPNTTLDGVLSAVRDYGDYRDFYKPTVVDSKLLANDGACDKYSMRVVNKETVSETALDMEYETCYYRVDKLRSYSITHTTRVQEIRHYGKPNQQELPPNQGTGYVWRLYSVARYEQRDGGTYVEVEAIALSRDIPVALRWLVNPIVRRVSRNSMQLSLQQTQDAVHSTQAGNRESTPNLYRECTPELHVGSFPGSPASPNNSTIAYR